MYSPTIEQIEFRRVSNQQFGKYWTSYDSLPMGVNIPGR